MGKTTNIDYFVVPDRERQRYDMKFKIHVAREAQTIGSLKASQRYGVSKSNVDHWRRGIDKLIKKATSVPPFYNSEPKSGRDYAVEQFVLDEIRSSLKRGIVVTKKDIQEKAAEFANSNNIDGFKANRPWCNNFLLRNDIYDNFGDEDDDEVMRQEELMETSNSNKSSTKTQPEPASSVSVPDDNSDSNKNNNNAGDNATNSSVTAQPDEHCDSDQLAEKPQNSQPSTNNNKDKDKDEEEEESDDVELPSKRLKCLPSDENSQNKDEHAILNLNKLKQAQQ